MSIKIFIKNWLSQFDAICATAELSTVQCIKYGIYSRFFTNAQCLPYQWVLQIAMRAGQHGQPDLVGRNNGGQ